MLENPDQRSVDAGTQVSDEVDYQSGFDNSPFEEQSVGEQSTDIVANSDDLTARFETEYDLSASGKETTYSSAAEAIAAAVAVEPESVLSNQSQTKVSRGPEVPASLEKDIQDFQQDLALLKERGYVLHNSEAVCVG